MYHDRLWQAAQQPWRQIREHPFLRELQLGTLSESKFLYFLQQDYAYLEDFARVLALGAARSPSGEELRQFLSHASGVFSVEQALHGTLTAALGGDAASLGSVARGPATEAYVDFLLRHGFAGDYARLVMATLPCFWIYREVGREMKQGPPSPKPLYQAWIDTYAGPEFAESVAQQLAIASRLGEAYPGRHDEFAAIFVQGVRHEYAFWQQAYDAEA